MLIRIIDKPAAGGEDMIRIEYQGSQWQKHYDIDLYSTPFSDNFRQTLAWYFNQYPLQLEQVSGDKDDRGVVQKVIRGGQAIGEELIGEDYELVKIAEDISQFGLGQLDVQLVSDRPAFFAELWETLVLPDSKFMLSTVARSFVRRAGSIDSEELAPLNYGLTLQPPSSDEVAQLLQGQMAAPETEVEGEHQSLRVLYWKARPEGVAMPFEQSNALELAFEGNRCGTMLDLVIEQASSLDRLEARLKDVQKPVHVFHYDGPVLVSGDKVSFALDNQGQALIDCGELCELLVSNNVGLLSVDARRYQQQTPKKVLAMIASQAYDKGLGNVLGLSQITNPWTSSACFGAVYRKIATGLELSQAVVEARKAQQRATANERFSPAPLEFHDWSLLVHYSWQKVQFFEQGLAEAQQDDPNYLKRVNEKLHGYQSQLQPPLLFVAGDGQATEVLGALNASGSVAISGQAGIGKSWTAHVASVYLALQDSIDYGFYFDFSKEHYRPQDMLQMIAVLLQLPPEKPEAALDKLADLHCCFVLDELPSNDSDEAQAVWDLIATLRRQGHKMMVTATSADTLQALDMPHIPLKPVSMEALKVIAAHAYRQASIGGEVDIELWHFLLSGCHGHPWLAAKLMERLKRGDMKTLVTELSKQPLFAEDGSVVDNYYRWQWQQMSGAAQRLLSICSNVRGLLLEMVVTVIDQKNGSQAGQTLLQQLDAQGHSAGELLNEWMAAGFLSRYPHGHLVDQRALPFLAEQPVEVDEAVSLNFSKVIAEGVAMLCGHVMKQPNQNISNNLLFNRRSWVEHFEKLWFGKDYNGFFTVKGAFDQLMQQARLLEEMELWSLDLLSRSPLSNDEENLTKTAWLSLAAGAVVNDKAAEHDFVAQAVGQWQDWLLNLDSDIEDEQRPVFQQAVTFLQNAYRQQGEWSAAIAVGEKALALYLQSEAWQRVIAAFKSQADLHGRLGEEDKALEYEFRLLDDIPYDGAPESFKQQQMVEIMLARLSRGNLGECQKMLDQVRHAAESQHLDQMLDNVQCEIDFKAEDYAKALPHLSRQWAMMAQAGQEGQSAPLKQRLLFIKDKLGAAEFERIYSAETEGLPLPE